MRALGLGDVIVVWPRMSLSRAGISATEDRLNARSPRRIRDLNAWWAISQGQTTPTAVAGIWQRTVDQHIRMHRHLAGLERVGKRLTKLVDAAGFLVEDRVLSGGLHFHFTFVVRARNETHGRVFSVGVVNGKPDRDRSRRAQGPERGVLVPRHRPLI